MSRQRRQYQQSRRRRVAPAAAAAARARRQEEADDFEPLLSSSPWENDPAPTRRTTTAFLGNNRNNNAARRHHHNVLQPMQVSTDNRLHHPSATQKDDLNDDDESSPLLKSRQEMEPLSSSFSLYTTPSSITPLTLSPTTSRMYERSKHYQHASVTHRHYLPHHPIVARSGSNPIQQDFLWSLLGCWGEGCCCCQCVRTSQVGVQQTFGKFEQLQPPGFYCMPTWPCTRMPRVSLRVQQLNITLETKTKDCVFVSITVAIQFKVKNPYNAYYSLKNVARQVRAYVLDVVRSAIPRMLVDDVFVEKTMVSQTVRSRLQECMMLYGYEITSCLITDISISSDSVKAAMNEINASKRLKHAMPHKAEAFKVQRLKAAQGHAEQLYLEGVGLANQRKAIARGMKDSLMEKTSSGHFAMTNKDVMDVLLLSHYMDVLTTIGSNSLMVQYNPQVMAELSNQLSSYFVPANEEEQHQEEDDDIVASDHLVPHTNIPDLLW